MVTMLPYQKPCKVNPSFGWGASKPLFCVIVCLGARRNIASQLFMSGILTADKKVGCSVSNVLSDQAKLLAKVQQRTCPFVPIGMVWMRISSQDYML